MSRRSLSFILKALVSVILVWWLADRAGIEAVLRRLAATDPLIYAATVALVGAQTVTVAARWRWIATGLGLRLTYGLALRLSVIGTFFNQVLPSNIGGDAARIWYFAAARTNVRRAVHSVIVDRLVGLAALALITGLLYPLTSEWITDAGQRAAILLLAAAGFGGPLVVALLGGRLVGMLGRWRLAASVEQFVTDFRAGMAPGRRLPKIVAAAVMIHILSVAAMALIAAAISVPLGIVPALALIPPVLLMLAIPISLGGWGLREGVMVVALGTAGVSIADALSISVLFGIAGLLAALPGGILWVLGRHRSEPEPVSLSLEASPD